ncbi:multiheme c-type cytochrome [Desulfuromonas sp. AOP6]|uniref:multiheme c-type cytochrome n=1 Tax=Desulfuromonas sp. AOP6 TaxID=1566351 RepID=UPI0012760329|nr:multiheme c-type cytochrome [Desulfuromonas sp. AOP6]BCA78668.1 C-type polyheme cytochrome OmcB [Desulfuromonas sp. AOP6]
MRRRLLTLVPFAAVALMVVLLQGCGSNRDSSGAITTTDSLGTDATGISYAGAATCIECHEGKSWSAAAVSGYLAGAHVIHSDHIDQETAQADGCAQCHDPIADGRSLEAWLDSSAIPTAGLAAVTCEACHGAGGEHYGVGPMPNPLPGSDTCGKCHNDALPDSHLPHHPDADSIYERYAASAHAGSAGPGRSEYSTDGSKLNGHMEDHLPFGHSCVKCHTHEGAIEYLEVDDGAAIAAIDDGSGKIYTSMQCKTCHDPHKAGKLLEPAIHEEHPVYKDDGVTLDYLEVTTISSSEYNTCANCHDQEAFHLTKNVAWSMLETHGDDPNTTDIEGYVIDETAENACSACHDVHSANITINQQWAKSGHAAEIALVKEELGPDAVISLDDEHERHSVLAFTEINNAFAEGRETCQRCHTTTGAKNYMSDPANYDPANNDFSHLDPVYDENTGELLSNKVEMLYCGACHTSATTGDLAVSGADIVLDYTYGGEEIILKGVNESKACLTCHGGWGNNDSLVAMDDAARDFHGVLHHGPAGAVLFAEETHAGYEFAGQVYDSTPHDIIGTTDANGNEVVPGTGTAGPCVACHMPGKNHSNSVVDVESMTINSEGVCNSCHSMTVEILEAANKGRKQTASYIMEVVKSVLIDLDYPEADLGGLKPVLVATVNPTYLSLDQFRAAMNWWVVYDDFGAHAHNPTYVKQIAFDTIDYLENGTFTGTITVDTAAWLDTVNWLGGDPTTGVVTRP